MGEVARRGTVLITGATGQVGRELVEQLLREDPRVRVRVLVRDRQRIAHLGNRIEIAQGDLDKPETLADAMRGVDRLYFVTPVTDQVARLLEAAKHAGVGHIVKQSTIEADRSLGPGKWHREQEELVKGSGMDWTIVRPTMMMTNTIGWWAATIKSQGAVYFPGGSGRVPAIDPRDIAAVARRVLAEPGHEGKTYAVTGPESLAIAEMVGVIGRVLGRRIRYVSVPSCLAGIWLRRSGLSKSLVKALIETLRALRKSEYAYVTQDVERVTRCTPRSFERWCRENV